MPSVDFESVRSRISMAQVLELVGFQAVARSGDQLRGPCPIHGSSSSQSRSFSVNVATHRYQCFKCGSKGGQLELWAKVRGVSVYQAALELCDRMGIETPWVRRR